MDLGLSSTNIAATGILLLALIVGAVLFLRSRSKDSSASSSSATFGDASAPLDVSKFDGLVENLMRDIPQGGNKSSSRDDDDGDDEDSLPPHLRQQQQAPPPPTDIMRGETDRYQWSQTAQEVDIYVNIPEGTRKNQLSCTISANKLVVTLDKQPIVEGKLPAEVKPDECNWQLEASDGKQKLWISLFKAKRTERGTHWRRVIQGDLDLNPDNNRPPMIYVNPSDPESMRAAMERMK